MYDWLCSTAEGIVCEKSAEIDEKRKILLKIKTVVFVKYVFHCVISAIEVISYRSGSLQES